MTKKEATIVAGLICDAWDASYSIRSFVEEFPKFKQEANEAYKENFGYYLFKTTKNKKK